MKQLAASLLAGALAVSAFAATTPARADDAPAEQWRSYWVDAFNPGIYDPAQVGQLVEDAKAVGANALIVQTVRRYDCFCNDAQYPRTDAAVAPAPYDPLEAIIDEAHAAGIEVHAWVNVSTLWNSATAPTSPEHVYNAHGLAASGADRWLNKRHDGVEKVGNNTFIDPANPDAVEYIVDGIRSIQERYDVDGINLDYIRYPDYNVTGGGEFTNDWGYSDVSLARFHAATGRTDVPEPADEEFSHWRREQITNLVRKIYVTMHETDRTDRLSINGITYAYGPSHYGSWEQARPYANVMQDWHGWAREGIVDTVTAMNYKREWRDDQAEMFATWNDFIAQTQRESGRDMVSGPALYLNDIDSSVQQAREVTELGLGWSGYSYANVSIDATAATDPAVKVAEREAVARALRAEVFTGEARVPEMEWKTRPTDGILAGQVLIDGRVADQVALTITGPGGSRTVRTDGDGWFAALKLVPGRYKVKIADTAAVRGVRPQHVVVDAGEVARVELSLRGK